MKFIFFGCRSISIKKKQFLKPLFSLKTDKVILKNQTKIQYQNLILITISNQIVIFFTTKTVIL